MSKLTVLITGCSQGGIGDALAHQFAAHYYHVFAAARNLNKTRHFSNASIEVVKLDVTSADSINALVAHLKEILPEGKLDVLVNNAGFGATGPLIEADLDTARRLYEVNVLGLLAVTKAFAPMLIAAKGKVVNISSVGGLLAMPWGGLLSPLSFVSLSGKGVVERSYICDILPMSKEEIRTRGVYMLTQYFVSLYNRSLSLFQSRRHHHERDTSP